jgi:hypothetical protein
VKSVREREALERYLEQLEQSDEQDEAVLGRRKRFRVKEKRFQTSAEKCVLTEPISL